MRPFMEKIQVECLTKTTFSKFSVEAEVLRAIVMDCLWHEPHSLREMIAEIEIAHHPWAGSKRDLMRCICSALREAMICGLIRYCSEYFLLTESGREQTGRAFGLEDD
jgi:hypothetical protein